MKNIFRCSHSQCSIFVEVDCSGYGAASVVRASLRHVIEDVMDGNITTGKLHYSATYIVIRNKLTSGLSVDICNSIKSHCSAAGA